MSSLYVYYYYSELLSTYNFIIPRLTQLRLDLFWPLYLASLYYWPQMSTGHHFQTLYPDP